MPPNVKTIKQHVMRNNRSETKVLTYVEIGKYVTSIGQYFCNGQTSIRTIVFRSVTPPSLGYASFKNGTTNHANSTYKIYVPDEAVDAYKAGSGYWSDYKSRILPLSQLEG